MKPPASSDRAGSRLFTPFPIGRAGRILPNRIWLPAMVTWRASEDGHVTPAVGEIYRRYAQGGAGMLVLEAIGIRDVKSGPLLRLGHDRFIPGLRALRSELRTLSDALVIPQIIDFLKISTRRSTRAFIEEGVRRGTLPESTLDLSDAGFEQDLDRYLPDPRQQRDFRFGWRQTVEDLEAAEIQKIPGWFAAAARRAQTCGFDGVELHFAHAYTLASFLSVTNQRRDAYGGSLENRLRLAREVIEEVRGAVGPDFLVGCRYLGSEDILGADGRIHGNTVADAQQLGVAFAAAGLDFLSISRGGRFEDARQPPVGEAAYPYTGHSGARCIPRGKRDPPGVNLPLAAAIRQAVRSAGHTTPVVAAGKIHTFLQAEAVLREQSADLVGVARALLADPDLPRKWLAGADTAVRGCVFCPYCEEEDQRHRLVTCTLWPKDPADHRRRLTPQAWNGAATPLVSS